MRLPPRPKKDLECNTSVQLDSYKAKSSRVLSMCGLHLPHETKTGLAIPVVGNSRSIVRTKF